MSGNAPSPASSSPVVAEALLRASDTLADAVDALRFAPPVAFTYNPLRYARAVIAQYLTRCATGRRRVLLVGMNPGPFGMAQTGIPFGQVAAVRDWMKFDAPIGRPVREHPKRPVQGFACTRSEVSGARLWGAIGRKFPVADDFFRDHFVVNYCPLLFLSDSGANMTPDKLPLAERAPLQAACDAHLRAVVDVLQPEVVIGVGAWASKRAQTVLGESSSIRVGTLPHPSPASPQANAGWDRIASAALRAMDVDEFV